MIDLIMQHQVASALIAFYIYSSFVGALPTPTDKSNNLYKFTFSFAHLLGANVMRIPWMRNIVGNNNAN